MLDPVDPLTQITEADTRWMAASERELADAARRSGPWLACRPGCVQCCHGTFAISQLDAFRLQRGMQAAEASRVEAILQRAEAFLATYGPTFPGNRETGILGTSEEEQEQFEDYANEAPCPVLNPATGLCDLYEHRPTTCRVFGPPVRSEQEGGLGVCELCFIGAPEEAILAAELHLDPEGQEPILAAQAEKALGITGDTLVAFAVLRGKRPQR